MANRNGSCGHRLDVPARAPAPLPATELTLGLRHAGVTVPVAFHQRPDGKVAWKYRARGLTAMGIAPTLFGAIDSARDHLQCTDEELEEWLAEDDGRLLKLLEASWEQAAYRKGSGAA